MEPWKDLSREHNRYDKYHDDLLEDTKQIALNIIFFVNLNLHASCMLSDIASWMMPIPLYFSLTAPRAQRLHLVFYWFQFQAFLHN